MLGHTFGRMSRGGSDDEMFGKLYDINVIKRISPYIWRYKKYSAIGAICTLLSASLAVLIPYFIKIGIDDYINNPNIGIASQKSGLIKISLIFGLTMFAAWVTNYIGQIYLAKVGQYTLRDIRIDMFSHLQKLLLTLYNRF